MKLKYKTDSKEIEERQITPIVENINRFITWICKKFDMGAENNLIRDFERENNILLDAEKQIKREEREKKIEMEI